jgi:hypothetical protein
MLRGNKDFGNKSEVAWLAGAGLVAFPLMIASLGLVA